MQYRVVNLDTEVATNLMNELGHKVTKGVKFHDAHCLDMFIDPDEVLLRINDGNITVDRCGVLFTILRENYSAFEII